MRRLAARAVVVALFAAPGACHGDERVMFSFPVFAGQPRHRVVSVDPAKRETIIETDDQGASSSPMVPAEGPAILVVASRRGAAPDAAVRVEITEVLEDGSLRATFGPGAAGIVAEGTALVFRPLAGDVTAGDQKRPSTKSLRALPDVVRAANPAPAAAGKVDPISAAQAAARRQQSMNNLKQIALAFFNFHDHKAHFPPAAVIGPDGRPWHSWRVLVLPFLEERDLYEQYDFSQPWDSPKNMAIAEKVPKVFQDPAVGAKDGSTHYAVLVGDATLFPSGRNATMKAAGDTEAIRTGGLALPTVTDGTSNTIMIATVDPTRRIPWTKPEDIVVGPDGPSIGTPEGIGAIHAAGKGKAGLVAIADGSVRALSESLDAKILAALATRNGGEVIDRDSLAVEGADDAGNGMRAIKIVAGADGSLVLRAE